MDKADKILLLLVISCYQTIGDYENPYWNCFFYCGFSAYFIINLFRELQYTFIKKDRLIIKLTMVYFAWFFITEAICFFDINKFYYIFITNSNRILSDAILILVIMLTLTLYIQRNERGKNERQRN